MARTFLRTFSHLAKRLSRLHISMQSPALPTVFLPPVNKSMRDLDRSFFRKTISISACTVFDPRHVASIRKTLHSTGETLLVSGIKAVLDDETTPGSKLILLAPHVTSNEESWSTTLVDLVKSDVVKVRPYDLTLTYENFSMINILDAVLPDLPEDEKETPAGFAQVGHVAHLNLRNQYLPYKYLIGQILADKNANVKTVINKISDVGAESVFRTFSYEVLAGPDDLDVTVSHLGCQIEFNYGKAYWNTRLSHEHERMIAKFKKGEAVCDVMAGVGPFALPAGKQGVFVRANDLNPESYKALAKGISRNKVDPFVSASCLDGRSFIVNATVTLPHSRRTYTVPPPKVSRTKHQAQSSASSNTTRSRSKSKEIIREPGVFSHYVMNLPATAVEFLDAFKGVYQGREKEFFPHTDQKLPMIHAYTFQLRHDDEKQEQEEVCQNVSKHLGAEIKPDNKDLDVEIFDVRLVAPKKKMYCASFRLPAEVAFAPLPVSAA